MIGDVQQEDDYRGVSSMGGEDAAAADNVALRVLLEEAEMSNAGLARAVVVTGAEEGTHVGTNTTAVRRMLDGCQPHWPVPRLVAKVLPAAAPGAQRHRVRVRRPLARRGRSL